MKANQLNSNLHLFVDKGFQLGTEWEIDSCR